MSSLYNVLMANATIVANGELVTIRAATAYSSRASVLRIYRISLSQSGTSVSQQLAVRWGLKASAFGTFVSATPVPLEIGAVASAITGSTSNAASTCGVNNTGSAGAGTLTVLDQQGFNNLNGFLFIPVPEERPLIGPDLTLLVQIQGTPTTLTGWNATVTYEEVT